MEKSDLRKKYLQKREGLSLQEIEDKSLAIANQCLNLPIWEKSMYSLFLSITEKKEVHTDFLLHILQGRDKNIVVSKTLMKSRRLKHYLLTDNTKIKVSKWGIPEPEGGIEITPAQMEVVFVPLLAYDQHGNRIGYGGGFYDRFLSQCPPHTLKIGLSFFPPETESFAVEETDIALDYGVTPEKIYTF